MTSGRTTAGTLLRALALACVLATTGATVARAADDDDAGQSPAATNDEAPASAAGEDPWEGMNRGIFWFNDQVDVHVLAPVARGYDWVVPGPIQTGIGHFFNNLRFPIVFVNEAFQAKPIDALRTLARFGVNTTIGLAGFLDPASEIGLPRTEEDFGQTLGRWGVPAGPYLVLPLLGPSTVRDTGGLALDSATSITPFFVDTFILVGARLLDVVNTRARFLQEVDEAKAASLDYYVFVRDAYEQRRRALIEDRAGSSGKEFTPDEDLYNVVEP